MQIYQHNNAIIALASYCVDTYFLKEDRSTNHDPDLRDKLIKLKIQELSKPIESWFDALETERLNQIQEKNLL